jgi:hypothetical protein
MPELRKLLFLPDLLSTIESCLEKRKIIDFQGPGNIEVKRTVRHTNSTTSENPKAYLLPIYLSVDTVYLIICNNLLANDTIILTNDTRSHTNRKFIGIP